MVSLKVLSLHFSRQTVVNREYSSQNSW